MPTTFVISVLNSLGRLGSFSLSRGGAFKGSAQPALGALRAILGMLGCSLERPFHAGFLNEVGNTSASKLLGCPFHLGGTSVGAETTVLWNGTAVRQPSRNGATTAFTLALG